MWSARTDPAPRRVHCRTLVLGGVLVLGCLVCSAAAGAPPPRGQPAPSSQPLGDAWHDRANPVVKRFGGERLDLWSLKKPVRPRVPDVRHADWPRNPIDRFVLARLEKAGLTPSPEADRRTLIRRLYFDLLGLPPAPAEVQRFVNDPAGDAYERLVERLLASKHYGERWGRHWLDVVRYADTNGFERDEFRPAAWRYRDYVLRAFNEDKPYDAFIREQLAGDELAPTHLDERGAQQVIATGFLRLGPYDSTAALFVEDQKGRDYLMADLVSTTGSAFLGLTLACCQCHDHKYDPFLQADHFRLRAFFAGVKYRDDLAIETDKSHADTRARVAALDAQAVVLNRRIEALRQPAFQHIRAARRQALAVSVFAMVGGRPGPLPVGVNAAVQWAAPEGKILPRDIEKVLTPEQRSHYDGLAKRLDLLKGLKQAAGTAMAMTDSGPKAPPTHVFAQGDISRPLGEVLPGVLSVFDPAPAKVVPPKPGTTGRRTALADWIASKDNPLTARVLVNRLWQHHFGQGIVASPNDFGFSGVRPTHPELLDWLAVEFMARGWSVKDLHRLMLHSATYRQASVVESAKQRLDPDNRLLWRQNLYRLEAEILRDAQLAVAGTLLPRGAGPPLWPEVPVEALLGNPVIFESASDMAGRLEWWYTDPPEQTDVRSVFLVQKRSVMVPLLQVFDQPDMVISCGRRNLSTVAPQALALMNSTFGVRLARQFAARVAHEAGPAPARQAERAVWLALGRAPDRDEQVKLVRMLERHRELHQQQPTAGVAPAQAALVDLCRVLLNLNEFVYID